MNGKNKGFPASVNVTERPEDADRFHWKDSYIGIVTSLAIHAVFILLLLIQPIAKTMVPVKTFHISFEERSSSLLETNPGSSAAVGKGEQNTDPLNKHVEKRSLQARPKRPKMQKNTVVASSPVAREAVKENPLPVSEKIEAKKAVETTLPPILEDATGDEMITAAGHNPEDDVGGVQNMLQANRSGSPGVSGSGGGGTVSGSAAGEVSGNGPGGSASVGAGGGAPLETKFGEMNAPSFLHREMPVYPPIALKRGIEGRVILTLLIDQTGKVQKINVTESAGYGLTEAAIEAVKKSTFAPARVNGEKVVSRAVLPVYFRLE